jgi:hypothetical protein
LEQALIIINFGVLNSSIGVLNSSNEAFPKLWFWKSRFEIRGFVEPSVRRPESLKNRESLSHRTRGSHGTR